jgi:hypothetical protein
MLLKEVVYILLAIIALMILYAFISKLFGFVTLNESERAYGMLSNVKNSLDSIQMKDNAEIFIYTPKDMYFATFNRTEGPEDMIFPEKCFQQSCICICDKNCKKNYCLIISKPLLIDNKTIKLQIPANLMAVESASQFNAINLEAQGKGETKVATKKEKIEIAGVKIIDSYSLISRERTDLSKVNYIVLHHTGGSTFESAYQTLNQRGLSVHYIVDIDGIIYYLVDEKRLAFHALGFNDVSIGIEIVNTGNEDMKYTDAQYVSITKLLQSITSRRDIPYDNAHIIGHYETPKGVDRKWDPSPNFEWAKINLPDHVPIALAKVPSEAGYA